MRYTVIGAAALNEFLPEVCCLVHMDVSEAEFTTAEGSTGTFMQDCFLKFLKDGLCLIL